ncbi:MAG TPA: hypothetical protein VHD90_04615, partial [Phototrophicaceae bacterium]|nr:hypothetical protein [Phototrophicaceae bacterium]
RLWLQAELVGTGFLALALIGCISEYIGRRRVAKLRAKLKRAVCVERDGDWQKLSARELVPGDLIELKQGEIVPADVYIVGGDGVGINILHSNSLLSRVYQEGDLLYCGSPIRFGEVRAIVCVTGARTKLGAKVQWLVDHMNAASFYENPIRFDETILHFDEPLGGEWRVLDFLES